MNTEKTEIQKELEDANRGMVRPIYMIKVCGTCNKQFPGTGSSKRCPPCQFKKVGDEALEYVKQRRLAKLKNMKQDKCFFCAKTSGLQIHHIDKDQKNNVTANLLLLCPTCHRRLHSRVYNGLFKRFFILLINERFSYDQIGKLFGTTRQNVYNIINK